VSALQWYAVLRTGLMEITYVQAASSQLAADIFPGSTVLGGPYPTEAAAQKAFPQGSHGTRATQTGQAPAVSDKPASPLGGLAAIGEFFGALGREGTWIASLSRPRPWSDHHRTGSGCRAQPCCPGHHQHRREGSRPVSRAQLLILAGAGFGLWAVTATAADNSGCLFRAGDRDRPRPPRRGRQADDHDGPARRSADLWRSDSRGGIRSGECGAPRAGLKAGSVRRRWPSVVGRRGEDRP
jgi:hypothetical protein